MKKFIIASLSGVFVVLVLLSIYNFILNSKLQNSIDRYKERLEIKSQVATLREQEFNYLFNQNLISTGMTLKNIFVINEQGRRVRLCALFDNSPKLILRYSEINCMTCVDSSIKYLEKYKDSIGLNNIIILASYKRQQDVNTFKRVSKCHFEIFNTGDSLLGLPTENENVPFLFVTNDSLKTRGVFIPEKTMPELTEMYFKTIISRYFSSKN